MKPAFNHLPLLNQDLDLPSFYDFCSTMEFFNKNPVDSQNVETVKASEEKRKALNRFCNQLIILVKNTQARFHPALIELSLYDPKDRSGRRFFSIFIAGSETVIEKYIKGMDVNLADKKEYATAIRGPIIPSRKLHSAIYYSLVSRDDKNILRFNELGDRPFTVYAGRFENRNLRTPSEHNEILHKHIENFFIDVQGNSLPLISEITGSCKFNLSLLIPLFRPAAKFKGEEDTLFNGGGIFLYGELEQPSQEHQFVLEVQTSFTKALFKVSHTQVAIDEIETFKNVYTSMIIHQVKNKLTSQANELTRLLERHALSPQLNEKIREVRNGAEDITAAFTLYLNNMAWGLSRQEQPTIDIVIFQHIVESLSDDEKRIIVVPSIPAHSNACFKASKDSIELLLKELVDNAVTWYDENNITEGRQVTITWKEEYDNIYLTILSRNTFMDNETMKIYGRGPIRETSSTGLGGLFMNSILELLEAKKFPGKRHFLPQNTSEGFSFTIAFKLFSNTP